MSAAACASVTPGFSWAWNTKYRSLTCGSARLSATGRHRSAACFVNRAGITPTTVVGTPFSIERRGRPRRIGVEVLDPHLVGHHEDRRRAGRRRRPAERAAERGRHAEELERVGRDRAAGELLGALRRRHQHVLERAADDVLEHLVLFHVIEELRRLQSRRGRTAADWSRRGSGWRRRGRRPCRGTDRAGRSG